MVGAGDMSADAVAGVIVGRPLDVAAAVAGVLADPPKRGPVDVWYMGWYVKLAGVAGA